MARKKQLESSVAETILQDGISVKVGEKEYIAPAPTLATLFLVSKSIARFPKISESKKWEDVIASAVYAPIVAEIISTFILGAKALKMGKTRLITRLLPFLKSTPQKRLDALTEEVLTCCTSTEASDILVKFLGNAGLNDFFAVTTFLREANPTRPTKVVKETTAPGQS